MQKSILLILDGWGHSDKTEGNAIKAALTPRFDKLWAECPRALLHASGTQVGLPDGIMGNSEVGHENIGAGRVVKQKLTMISDMVKNGEFFRNKKLKNAFEHVKYHGSKLHLMGLISEGDVHSHIGHLNALVEMAEKEGLDTDNLYLHAISDGRDDPPYVAAHLLESLQKKVNIATVSGRYWAMDRDKNWDRNKKYFDCVLKKLNSKSNCLHEKTAVDAIKHGYEFAKSGKNPAGDSDEFIMPTLINKEGLIDDKDAVIFFNFRPDRARQISMLFEYFSSADKTRKDELASMSLFEGFSESICKDHGHLELENLYYLCFTEYSNALELPIAFRDEDFPVQDLSLSLGEVVSSAGFKQFRTAETEKFNHVTSFFNVRKKDSFVGETRGLVKSPKVATYDLQPEMSLPELTETLLDAINKNTYELIVCNFANPDMVGHTGKWGAIVSAIEAVDKSLAKVCDAAKANDYVLMVTADHGNADQVTEDNGDIRTAHSTNKVPFVIYNSKDDISLKQSEDLALANIAPTILEFLELDKPKAMAESLRA